MSDSKLIKNLKFKMTCGACPEQYDVFKNEDYVGYVRLRHGYLYVSDPNDDEVLWSNANPSDEDIIVEGDGIFHSEDEREYFLNKIADVLHKHINRKLC